MDKKLLISDLLKILQSNLDALVETSNIAREAATAEESKAENKYDTRGLEASYLAGAQSKRAIQLQESIYRISTLPLKNYNEDTPIGSTALVELDTEMGKKHFFLLPVAGGFDLKQNGQVIQTLAVDAPLARELLDKYVGDEIQWRVGDKITHYEIKNIY